MRPVLNLRCSSLPLFMRCPQSVRGDVNVNEWFPETDLGRALHAIAARFVLEQPYDVATEAARQGVDAGDLDFLVGQVVRAWEELGLAPRVSGDPGAPSLGDSYGAEHEWKPLVLSETFISGPETGTMARVKLTGTSDVIVDRGKVVEVLDWKSGRRDADHREQLLGYCALALRERPAERAMARAVWLRELEAETYSMDRLSLAEWENRLLNQADDLTYRPGPHCSWCPRRFSCQARRDMAQASVALLANVAPMGQEVDLGGRRTLAQFPAGDQLDLYHRAQQVKALAERLIEEMRTLVVEGGPVEANGQRLEIQVENKRSIVPLRAWPILQQHLSDDALASAVTVHITKVEDGVAENKPRGEGAKARRAVAKALEDAGAINIHQVRKLVVKRSA